MRAGRLAVAHVTKAYEGENQRMERKTNERSKRIIKQRDVVV